LRTTGGTGNGIGSPTRLEPGHLDRPTTLGYLLKIFGVKFIAGPLRLEPRFHARGTCPPGLVPDWLRHFPGLPRDLWLLDSGNYWRGSHCIY
jgi:hypothetical protein